MFFFFVVLDLSLEECDSYQNLVVAFSGEKSTDVVFKGAICKNWPAYHQGYPLSVAASVSRSSSCLN